MDLNHSSCWDSILEKVKPHLPTIDFDSSSTEDEDEIVTIYQRPAALSLVIPEDFDTFSVDDHEEQSQPVAPAGLDVTCSKSLKLDDDKIEEVTSSPATQWGTRHSDADVEKADACQRGIGEMNRAKMDADVKPNVDNTKSDASLPVLSFARLDHWDLDVVLQNLKADRIPRQQHLSVEPVKKTIWERSQKDIMERLIAFCHSQLSKSISAHVESSEHIRQDPVCDRSSVRMTAELQRSHRECPTVHIDLRCPDPSIKEPRTSQNLPSESPAKHNSHQETPPAKKPNLDVHIGSQRGDREVTGKSMLLRKIREMNRNGNKYPSTDQQYLVQENKAKEVRAKVAQPECTCSHELHQPSSDVQSEDGNPKMESPTSLQSKIRKPKQQSDQRGQQVKQKIQLEQRKRILRQLETHRPTESANQKQPAAELTDVLYDFEASHLQSVSTLPGGIEGKGRTLLIVNLSSPGMVRAHGRRKYLHPAATRSHIYNALVAWFLSLVGPDPRHNEDEVGAKVPFWVAGLQQLCTEDGLALHVLAVARCCYTQRKRDADIHAPFYCHVSKFLSETSLDLIAERKNFLDPQTFAAPFPLPSSCLNCFISATSNKKVIDRTFGLSPGFYWQTVETQERVCKGRDAALELHTEVSVALGCKAFFLQPLVTHYTLQLVLDSGLDVCGLRLLYPPQGLLSDSAGAVFQRADDTCQPILALAVRGPHAHSVLKHLTSSLDPLLLPLHHRSQEPPLCCSPRLASQVHRELCLWFSGRLQAGSAQNHNQPLHRDTGSISNSTSPSFLCATTKADLLLVVSPVVPPRCYGQVLALCERRGFGLRGLQRLRLQRVGAAALGLTNQQALGFCRPHSVEVDEDKRGVPSHSLVLLLSKENALHHSVSLPAALMRELESDKLLGCVLSGLDGAHTVEPSICFHTVPYSSNLFHMFVRCMWTVPDPSSVLLSHQKWSSNSNMERVVILTLRGKDMSQGLLLLRRVLTEGPEDEVQHAGFELLGLKCLPALTRLQAQELSPYEVGEQLCHDSLDSLMSSPALVCALRRVDAFASLRKLLPRDYPGDLSVLMSPTPEVALRQASLFFSEQELIPDCRTTPLLKFLPPNGNTEDPQELLTVCLFKPRVWNHCLAKLVRKLQLHSLTLVGLHVVTLDRGSAASLLPAESDLSVLEAHVEYMCSGSSLALCLSGENAVMRLLDVLGQEDSSLWTTRYGIAHSYSGIYGSGSYQRAVQDVKRFFPEGLCCAETSTMRQEQIPSLCSDPLASTEREQRCTLTPVAPETLSAVMAPKPGPGSLIHSALWQTTCLLIPLNTPPLSRVPSQLDMLEQLLRSGCRLVAGRMSILDTEQRKHVAEVFKERMARVSSAPCLIVALQGETVVTCFNLILESIYKERSDLESVGKMIIYPESEEEAQQLTCYLFDALSPESCRTIEA